MAGLGQELEVKFLVCSLDKVEQKLQALGAVLVQPRQYENNLRFDTPDRRLTHRLAALRLRQDNEARMTYKGPPLDKGGARLRQELEFVVSDFAMARAFLEALGYQVVVMYEKYRATYALGETLVTLDEMPFGLFVEVEGKGARIIRQVSKQIDLRWELRCLDSYLTLFERLRQVRRLQFTDLSFANFAGMTTSLEELGLHCADLR